MKTEIPSPINLPITQTSISNSLLKYPNLKSVINQIVEEPIQENNINFLENNENNTIIYGKLGINTKNPDEALTVVGNLKITGNIYQPSDARVKENIKEVFKELINFSVSLYDQNLKIINILIIN